ncbi:hypothetical protein [Kitasatospora sp. NPDC088351]|uniref:hypothetical protein n=1 Tax=unclassified Kitasatospora TaxID=2633591 RepID=UPI00342706F9
MTSVTAARSPIGEESRAEAAGMSLPDYARKVLAEEADERRQRFLTAAAHFSQAWAPAFEAEGRA